MGKATLQPKELEVFLILRGTFGLSMKPPRSNKLSFHGPQPCGNVVLVSGRASHVRRNSYGDGDYLKDIKYSD